MIFSQLCITRSLSHKPSIDNYLTLPKNACKIDPFPLPTGPTIAKSCHNFSNVKKCQKYTKVNQNLYAPVPGNEIALLTSQKY